MRYIAVIDIGKTNAKLALFDLVEGRESDVRRAPNRVIDEPPTRITTSTGSGASSRKR
ncbi:hypothetical protein H2O14_14185 [Rhizobium sp. G21]|nr:hypothetical protein [Rhizobium sp. G21]MBB1249747.1 hypothetical protein [Rhizobium sp. G21]